MLDAGFVAAHGGVDPAIVAAAALTLTLTLALALTLTPTPTLTLTLTLALTLTTDPNQVAAAAAISRTNAVFEDQLGLRLVVGVLIVNSQAGGDFGETGPNAAPTQGAGTRTCDEYAPRLVEGHGVPVRVAGPNLALSRVAYWVQEYASRHAPVALWHLLTDCFPRDGTTGLSNPYPEPNPSPEPNPNPSLKPEP